MLPRPTESEHSPWGTTTTTQQAAQSSSRPSSSIPSSLSTSTTFSPDLGNSQHSASYMNPYGDSGYPLLPAGGGDSARSVLSHYSPVPPPLLAHNSNESYNGMDGRPNGLAMHSGGEVHPLPDSRGQWSAHDRRKSFRVTNSNGLLGEGCSDGQGWSSNLLPSQRRASWASPALPPFGEHQFSHSPLATDSDFLSPLSTPNLNPNPNPNQNLASSSTVITHHQPHSYPPQFQHPFLPSSANPISSSSSALFAQPYPFQPPPVSSSQDLSLPFRDFTGANSSQDPYSQPPSHLLSQQDHFLPNPSTSTQFAPPAPVPHTSYFPPSQSRSSQSRNHSRSSPPQSSSRRRSSQASSQPLNPSSPYIPSSDPSKPCPAILKAAAHRQQLGVLDITGRLSVVDKATRRTVMQASTRRAVELEFNCAQCGGGIGKLSLRGGAVDLAGGDNPANYVGRFVCSNCVPVPPTSIGGKERELAFTGYNDEAVYEDTLSGAVDRFQGLDLNANDIRPTPAPPGKQRTGFTPIQAFTTSKKRRASVMDVTEGILGCDVCRREIASGNLSCASGEAVNSSVEVLCAFCDTRYLRCSDCGGGGGTKGVGRWRCKEMFPVGRRTCQLLHTRLGLVNEMDYDVWPISQLSTAEREKVSTICAEVHAGSILGTLAVPDMIESTSAIARSFEEVEKICIDCWTTYDPLIRDDIEQTSPAATKRYIALRWSTPATRKKKSRAKTPAVNSDGTPSRRGTKSKSQSQESVSPEAPDPNKEPILFREGKTLSGFIIAEHDLEYGVLHVALTVPTGAGEAYDATSRLLQTLIARAHDDLAANNADRALRNLPLYPPLTQTWTMHMTKRDSRIMSRVETRRGFIPLDDFLAKQPQANREHFAPCRESYLPPELLRGWLVYAKLITAEDFPPNYVHRPLYNPPQQSHSQHAPLHYSHANNI